METQRGKADNPADDVGSALAPPEDQPLRLDPASLAPDQFIASDEVTEPDQFGASAEITGDVPLVSGNLWHAIWHMSWPLLITTVAGSIVGLVDVQVSGLIGSAAQAAVGLAEQVIFLFMIFLMSMGVGTTAIVSRAYGRKDFEETDHASGQSLLLSVLTGLVLTAVALLTARFILPLFSKSPNVVAQAELYLSVFSLYLVPFSLVTIANAAFRAIGDSKIPMFIVCTEIIINIAGDYLTVVYNWPVAGLGIRGIAFSAVAGSIFAALVAAYFIQRSKLKNSRRHLWPPSVALINRILHIGIPSAFQRLSWGLSVFGLFFVLARVPNPTAAIASWTVGMRIEGLLFMPQMALSMAVGSIVGQNLGAKQVDRAFRAGWNVTSIGVGIMLVLSIALFVFARQLAQCMSHDPGTIDYTTSYLQINALCEPFLAANSVLSGALQGAGDTRITMWIAIVSHWLIRLPLAWVLAIHMGIGASGAWIAMTTSVILSTVAVAIRFQTGGWVHKRI